jgi:hypothetical protein
MTAARDALHHSIDALPDDWAEVLSVVVAAIAERDPAWAAEAMRLARLYLETDDPVYRSLLLATADDEPPPGPDELAADPAALDALAHGDRSGVLAHDALLADFGLDRGAA